MNFELTNEQRRYFGLEPIDPAWDYVNLKGDQYRIASVLVYEDDIIKRQIFASEDEYSEYQFNVKTRNRERLLPKTSKGKEVKLSASTLEKKGHYGVYFSYAENFLLIGNISTQQTFYSNLMTCEDIRDLEGLKNWISEYINKATAEDLKLIDEFKGIKRRNIKYKEGDIFSYKIDNHLYGFGKILGIVREMEKQIDKDNHFFSRVMMKPLVVSLYLKSATSPNVDVNLLKEIKQFPSQLIADNTFFYGEHKIIGNNPILDFEHNFQINYIRKFPYHEDSPIVLQWGLLQKELHHKSFSKFLGDKTALSYDGGPHQSFGVGYHLKINKKILLECIINDSFIPYWNQTEFKNDLRNPINYDKKNQILKAFDLEPFNNYMQNYNHYEKKRSVNKITKVEKQIPEKISFWRKLFGI